MSNREDHLVSLLRRALASDKAMPRSLSDDIAAALAATPEAPRCPLREKQPIKRGWWQCSKPAGHGGDHYMEEDAPAPTAPPIVEAPRTAMPAWGDDVEVLAPGGWWVREHVDCNDVTVEGTPWFAAGPHPKLTRADEGVTWRWPTPPEQSGEPGTKEGA